MENVEEVLKIYETMKEIELEKTLMVLNPVPEEYEVPHDEIERLLKKIELEVEGKEVTPFLLKKLVEVTNGRTLRANFALLEENVKLAGEIAIKLKR